MTGGIFMMSNFEGLFSPWRDLEAEMDELRSMRRVSQMWRDGDRGEWTMYGRFFDRQMNDTPGSFSGFPNHRIKRNLSPKPDSNNVIVEFPTEDREIKIEIEPSVEITEVIDHSEQHDNDFDPLISSPRSMSPVRKSSLVNGGDYTVQLSASDNNVPSSNMSSVSEEQTVRSADSNRTEKRSKKVDFSKMEVHFEPGSGRVNIVETNGKPPSNQLFRRKKRHRERYRSDSPKLNFVGSPDDSYDLPPQTVPENIRFTELQNDLDLSIFNLRNSLFKNSIRDFHESSKNILNRSPSPTKYKSKQNQVNSPTNLNSDSSFNMSPKLQNMIQKTIIHHIHIEGEPLKRDSSPVSLETILSDKKYTRSTSPGNSIRKNNSLKRSNSRGRESRSNSAREVVENNKSLQEKPVHKTRVPVVRGDSFKKNSRVNRQDSVKSTSSRGSNGDLRVQKRSNVSRNNSGRISRTPSIGRNPSFSKMTTSSLKKGGIYVDASPKKSKGSTVTIISFSGKNSNLKSDETINRSLKNPTSNLNNSRSRIARKESFKSSRESLSSQSNRLKRNNDLKDTVRTKQRENTSISLQEKASLKKLNFVGRPSNVNPKIVPKSTVKKQDSFNSDVTPRYSNLRSDAQIKKISVDSVSKIKNINRINDENSKASFHHEDKSLFQPIKKERSVVAEVGSNEIKTPVAIRKMINVKETGRDTPTRSKINKVVSPVDKVERRSYTGIGSKLNFVSLKRGKEPLRSFEKISNGWVIGKCNMVSVDNDSSVKTEWPTKRVADISLNTVRPGNMSVDSVSPVSQISTGSRSNYYRQRESMMRLSKGFSSRPDNLTSPALSRSIDTRKRPARVYTPSISPSSVPSVGKRKPDTTRVSSSVRSDPPSEEPLYETLNSRRGGSASGLRTRRTRQTNPCCNI